MQNAYQTEIGLFIQNKTSFFFYNNPNHFIMTLYLIPKR